MDLINDDQNADIMQAVKEGEQVVEELRYCSQCERDKPVADMTELLDLCTPCLDRALQRDADWNKTLDIVRGYFNDIIVKAGTKFECVVLANAGHSYLEGK